MLDHQEQGDLDLLGKVHSILVKAEANAECDAATGKGCGASNLHEILEPDADVPERFDFSKTYRNELLRAKDLNNWIHRDGVASNSSLIGEYHQTIDTRPIEALGSEIRLHA